MWYLNYLRLSRFLRRHQMSNTSIRKLNHHSQTVKQQERTVYYARIIGDSFNTMPTLN